MGHVVATPAGTWRANWREPDGKQRARTFRTKREASAFLAQVETAKTQGVYVSPQGGRVKFAELAGRWLGVRNDEPTTLARDRSLMASHVVPQWGRWPIGKIGHLEYQEWITRLGQTLAPATVAECHRLTSAVCRSAVRAKLIGANPCDGVRLPKRRKRDTDDRVIALDDLRSRLLPAVAPARYRALIAAAGGTGTRWGEAAGLCTDAVDLDAGVLRVVRTVIEVSGRISVKPYPKSSAGRREIPLPAWLVPILREHGEHHPPGRHGLLFTNSAGGPISRTTFRSRVWRPSLVRAGLLGEITACAEGYEACWTDSDGLRQSARFTRHEQAVAHLAKVATGAPTFHSLRHSYATHLVDRGVPINTVQKVLGHEKASTTLDLYARKSANHARVLEALETLA